jgi:hypothetical protein
LEPHRVGLEVWFGWSRVGHTGERGVAWERKCHGLFLVRYWAGLGWAGPGWAWTAAVRGPKGQEGCVYKETVLI